MYYSVWETLGREKRDLLKSNVESARDEQKEVQEKFSDALANIKRTYNVRGDKLESVYRQMKTDYEDARDRSDDLSKRIKRIERLGKDLFDEWSREVEKISNQAYRRSSQEKLRATKQRFSGLVASLHAAEKRIAPVLKKLEDQVLFVKHNLNAASMGVFKAEADAIEKDINGLQMEITKSVMASESFVKSLDRDES
jgi:predicted  nucleic acid-binding Zn-ribbon protein